MRTYPEPKLRLKAASAMLKHKPDSIASTIFSAFTAAQFAILARTFSKVNSQ
jgi:hypothetical protein